MRKSDYIKQKFQSFGIQLSEADLLDLNVSDEEVTNENIDGVIISMVKFIPSLLLRPSINESGFSITLAQRENIISYYSLKCNEYGIKDELSDKPKVEFL